MRVLGIGLKAPSATALAITAALVAIASTLGFWAFDAHLMPANSVLTLTIGTMGGSLATACGVDLRKLGWRGPVLTMGFVVACAFAFVCLAWLAA